MWVVSTAGLIFYATWLSKFLKRVRNPAWDESFNPYMSKLSDWVAGLTSIQMMNLSLVLYIVPVILVYVIVNYVPAEWIAAVQPHIAFVVSVLLVYIGQQWAYKSPTK